MQLLARLMDHALAARGERTTIVVATSGDTGGAAVEAFRGREPRRPVRAVSARPHLRRAAADDDHRRRRQRPCARDRRHLRRLPGDREGPVQPPRLPRPGAALGRQLDQLGAHRRAGGLLLHRRGRARRAASQGRVHGADRQFRRHLRRLRRHAHGPADRPAGDRHQRQRHPGAHARDRQLRAARGGGDHLAVDGHPGVVEFRAAAVRGLRPRRRGGARADGHRSRSRAASRCRARALSEIRALFAAGRADEEETAATIRTTLRETGAPRRSAHRRRRRGRREGNPRSGDADGRARHRACRQVSRCGGGRLRRRARRCRTGSPTCRRARNASPRCRSIRRAVERFILAASRAAREGAAA